MAILLSIAVGAGVLASGTLASGTPAVGPPLPAPIVITAGPVSFEIARDERITRVRLRRCTTARASRSGRSISSTTERSYFVSHGVLMSATGRAHGGSPLGPASGCRGTLGCSRSGACSHSRTTAACWCCVRTARCSRRLRCASGATVAFRASWFRRPTGAPSRSPPRTARPTPPKPCTSCGRVGTGNRSLPRDGHARRLRPRCRCPVARRMAAVQQRRARHRRRRHRGRASNRRSHTARQSPARHAEWLHRLLEWTAARAVIDRLPDNGALHVRERPDDPAGRRGRRRGRDRDVRRGGRVARRTGSDRTVGSHPVLGAARDPRARVWLQGRRRIARRRERWRAGRRARRRPLAGIRAPGAGAGAVHHPAAQLAPATSGAGSAARSSTRRSSSRTSARRRSSGSTAGRTRRGSSAGTRSRGSPGPTGSS